MVTQTGITIYHQQYNPVTRLKEWSKAYYEKVSLLSDVKVNVLDGGLKSANVIKIRIPTTETIDIANGDKIMIGSSSSAAPSNDAYTVIGFADNRKGSKMMWHWKVICA